MAGAGALAGLLVIVAGVLCARRAPLLRKVLRWLPTPLWCYALPMIAVAVGWLPARHSSYQALTTHLLPVALALLLLDVHLPAVARIGWKALAAMGLGAASIVVGTPLVAWLLRGGLPPEAWKGVGTLAATWTGGSMNLLAMRALLDTPEAIFTSLMIVDAIIAYGWMAVLMAASSHQAPIDRWLRAPTPNSLSEKREDDLVWGRPASCAPARWAACALLSGSLAMGAGWLARFLPPTTLITTRGGWTVLLVTTAALCAAMLPAVRRMGRCATRLGTPCLYVVLSAMGAQASLAALWASPLWIVLGVGVAVVHGAVMLAGGRMLRLPLGVLATASQANFGGVVSAPLVGAVYGEGLAPIGLCLAIAGNAVGTYLGLCAASLAHGLIG